VYQFPADGLAMNRIVLLAGLLVFGAGIALARADQPEPADAAAIEDCLKEARGKQAREEACIGRVADPCLDKAEDPSTHGMADCSRREHAVWDLRLNRAYRALMRDLEPAQRTELRNAQRAWIAFADKKCGLHRVLEEGTITIPIAAYCDMVETGRQALFLERLLGEGDNPDTAR
jgi:uncharacterized protein YecT (DUF1311 family)